MRVLKLKFLCLQLAHPVPHLLSLFSAHARFSLSINNIGDALRTYCVHFFLFTSVCPLSSDQYLTPCGDHWGSSSSFPSPFVFLSQSVSAGHIDGTCGNLQESIDQVVFQVWQNRHLVSSETQVGQNQLLPGVIIGLLLGLLLFFPRFFFLVEKKTHNTLLFKSDTVWICLNNYNILVHTHMVNKNSLPFRFVTETCKNLCDAWPCFTVKIWKCHLTHSQSVLPFSLSLCSDLHLLCPLWPALLLPQEKQIDQDKSS